MFGRHSPIPPIRHWHMRELASVAEATSWITAWSERWAAETDASWAVIGTDSGQLMGQVSLRFVSLEFGQGQVTYWVLPQARRRRVATRATDEVTRWAMSELGLHRLTILHSTSNEASCGVAENVQYRLEGVMVSALLHDDGWHDMHLHARVQAPD